MATSTEAISGTDKLLTLNPNIYSFFSGAMISVSVNLYTGIFSNDTAPSRWLQVLAATLLTAASSVFWGLLAWRLEAIQKLMSLSSDAGQAWTLLMQPKRTKLKR